MRARVRLGGGSLRVESTPGAGTTIEAWLPRWQVAETEAAPA
jgi:signal transduction histidine kinase